MQPDKNRLPTGRVIQVLGDHMAPGMEIDVAIRNHDIPHVWPDDVLVAAKLLGELDPASRLLLSQTGQCLHDRTLHLRRYRVTVTGDELWVDLL